MLRKSIATIAVALLLTSAAFAQQNIAVVFDDSGSMSGRRMDDAHKALTAVVNHLPADTQLGIYAINAGWAYPADGSGIGKLDRSKAVDAINNIRASGGTPLGSGIQEGGEALRKLRNKYHYGFYRMLIVTDGQANDPADAEKYLSDVGRRNIRTDLIGLDMSGEHHLATVAKKNGTYKEADDAESLTKVVKEVLAESGGSSGDAKEDDFELLAGIPDKMASACLASLQKSTYDNVPIGDQPLEQVVLDETGHVVLDENGDVVTEPVKVEDSGLGIGGLFLAFIGIIVAIVIVVIFVNRGRR